MSFTNDDSNGGDDFSTPNNQNIPRGDNPPPIQQGNQGNQAQPQQQAVFNFPIFRPLGLYPDSDSDSDSDIEDIDEQSDYENNMVDGIEYGYQGSVFNGEDDILEKSYNQDSDDEHLFYIESNGF